MTPGSNPHQLDPKVADQSFENVRRQIDRLFVEVAQLSEQDLPPNDYYCDFLQRVLGGIHAPAGAVWIRTAQGNLQLQYQINLRQVGLDGSEEARKAHHELLRLTCQTGRAVVLPPHSSAGNPEGGAPAAGNGTEFVLLLAPILIDKQVAGLVEVWQDPRRKQEALPGSLQYLIQMAALASLYARNLQLRQMLGLQQIWTQLEAFARQIHSSLSSTEVGYLIVNEGRRLVGCDRLSAGVKMGKVTRIEAISGADVVEKRSNLVQLMRRLVDQVLIWGERLVYSGTKDDSLPPMVLQALDAYLEESNCKLLVVMPLKDERETERELKPRSALVMESFEPPESPDQLMARLEVVGKHSASALYNAVEHCRIPFRWIWMPLAYVREGLGGTAKAITIIVASILLILLLTMILVPYPLKMNADGQLLPEERSWVYSKVSGQVKRFPEGLSPGSEVTKGLNLILMHDLELEVKINGLNNEINGLINEVRSLDSQLRQAKEEADRVRITGDMLQKKALLSRKQQELRALRDQTGALEDQPGYYWIKATQNGAILSSDFRETLTNRTVKASDPLLRIGNLEGEWEVELKIPQKNVGQIRQAFQDLKTDVLDVDLLLLSVPTQTFTGKLSRDKLAGEANPSKGGAPGESEPVVSAWVRIQGADIPKDDAIPPELLVAGTEVHAKVRCGYKPMIYSMFYGVWEFFYEKVVFFF